MHVIGLTGGIGMGKSTAAAAFRRAHIPVFDADAAVHRIQGPDGRALRAIETTFPGTVTTDPQNRRVLNRAALRSRVLTDPQALKRLESIVHPLVRREELIFLARVRREGARIAVLDIPLLLETGGDQLVSLVLVVSAPRAIQIARVRQRRNMDPAQVQAVLARQMPDAEKRRRADLIVRTGLSRNHALKTIQRLIQDLRRP